jgi:hypothetical protein
MNGKNKYKDDIEDEVDNGVIFGDTKLKGDKASCLFWYKGFSDEIKELIHSLNETDEDIEKYEEDYKKRKEVYMKELNEYIEYERISNNSPLIYRMY